MDRAGAFGEGSMAPKVRAAIDFVRRTGGRAVITELIAARTRCAAKQGRPSQRRPREHPRVSGEGDPARARACRSRRARSPRRPTRPRRSRSKIGGTVVVKAQVHAGGRGKAGGVKLAKTPAEAREKSRARSSACRSRGSPSRRCSSPTAADIASEAYVGIILDRATKKPVFMVSPAGGIDIEEVAAKTPEKILKLPVDTRYGLQPFQAMQLGFFLYRRREEGARGREDHAAALHGVHEERLLARRDQSARRRRPTARSSRSTRRWSIDDNELDRHAEHRRAARRDAPRSRARCEARNANLTFIKLDGNVGCVVNGAGLAMATMDLVKYYGGEPANFLDIGGSSNPGEGRQRAPHHHRRPEREGDPVQHLRRHHAHRRRRERHRDGDEAEPAQGADRHPPHRHERRDRDEDPARRTASRRSTDMDEAVQKAVELATGGKAA